MYDGGNGFFTAIKVQIGTAAAFDLIHAAILAADGSGYFLVINQTTVGVQIVDAAGNTAGLIGGTAAGAGTGIFGVTVPFPSTIAAGQTVHAQVRIYIPTGFTFAPTVHFLKFMRFDTEHGEDSGGFNGLNINDLDSATWGNDANGGPLHGVTSDGQRNFNSESGNPDVNIWTTGNLNKGAWQEFEFEVKLGAGPTGSVKAWQKISGVWTLILNLDNTATLADPSHVCGQFLLHTYFNGNSPQTQSDYVDRIVVESALSKLTQTDAAGNKIIGESV